MMRWIVRSCLKFRILVIAIAAAIMVFGITQLRDVPMDAYPEFAPLNVEIQIESLGLSAAEVEALVTVLLESGFLCMAPWLKQIRSETFPGMTSIVLSFKPGTNPLHARQMVQERLTQAHTLPDASKPPAVLQPLSSTSRFLKIGLTSGELSLLEMSVLARWTIKPRLMDVAGVANVAIWGERERQLQVQVDPKQLQAKGVMLDQIVSTTGNALWVSPLSFLIQSAPGAGGWIDTPNQRIVTRHQLPIKTADDLAQVVVEGTTLRLGDVTTVVENHQPLIGDAIIGDGPGLLFVVEKLPWASTLKVTQGVEAALDALRPSLSRIEIDTEIFRPATFIEKAINNFTTIALISAILMLLILFASLYNWRCGLISFVSIIMSVMVAFLVLYLRGAMMNMMVFAGLVLALGVIVDDAIIDIENIIRRLRQHRKEGSEKSIVKSILKASLEIRSTIIFATLIIVLVMVPLFFMEGVSGALFKPLALSYVLAVLASMLVALTLTPALSLMLLRNAPLEGGESPLIQSLKRGYDGILACIIHSPRPVWTYLITIGIIVLAGYAVLPWLWQPSLLPSFKQRDLLVNLNGAPGISHPEITRITNKIGRELRSIPGVSNVGAHVGRAVTGDQVVGINSSQLWVRIDPATNYDTTKAAVQEVIDGYPGLSGNVLTYPEDRIKKVQTQKADKDMVVRISGHDFDVLRDKAEEVKQVLAQIDGIVDTHVERQAEEPAVEIKVDLNAVKRYGLKPGDVRRTAATLLSGLVVGNLFEEQKVFDVVVWGMPETRHSLTGIRELLIDTPDGGHVRLGDVAEVRIIPSLNVIKREASSRRIDIDVTVSGRDLGAVAREVEHNLKQVEFPLDHHAELLGGYGEQQAARQRIIGFALAVAIGIFFLLQAFFRSWLLAFVVFLTLPMALAGGVLTALAGGSLISLASLMGFFMVLGIAVRNNIIQINHYRHLEQHENEAFGPELVRRGTRQRIAPVLMTAVCTAVALLPLLFFGNIAGLEIIYPMAVVILGGLVTSTLFNLFVTPALYLRFGSRSEAHEDLFETEAILDVTSVLQSG